MEIYTTEKCSKTKHLISWKDPQVRGKRNGVNLKMSFQNMHANLFGGKNGTMFIMEST